MLQTDQFFDEVALAHFLVALPFAQQSVFVVVVAGFEVGSVLDGSFKEFLLISVHAFGLFEID